MSGRVSLLKIQGPEVKESGLDGTWWQGSRLDLCVSGPVAPL